jgi:hypothetical protein
MKSVGSATLVSKIDFFGKSSIWVNILEFSQQFDRLFQRGILASGIECFIR